MNKFTTLILLISILFFAGCCTKVELPPEERRVVSKVNVEPLAKSEAKVLPPKQDKIVALDNVEVLLLPQDDGSVGKLIVYKDSKEAILDEAWQRVQTDNLDKKEILSEELVANQYKELFEALPEPLKTYRLNFQFDSSDITDDSIVALKEISQEIQSSSAIHVDVIGFTDKVGDKSYNRTLSMERAKKVVELLESNGIDAKMIHSDYYGEAYPIEKTDDNIPSKLNRRVEVTIK